MPLDLIVCNRRRSRPDFKWVPIRGVPKFLSSWGVPVILDRTDYIDKVESNLGDGSFDLLPSFPSLAYYQIVKDWGTKWVNKGEITQPLLDCILNVRAKPGKNYGLIKTHKPNNPIRLITSRNGTVAENLSVFTEYFLHPCIKKSHRSSQILQLS